jgi:hypothetical protein
MLRVLSVHQRFLLVVQRVGVPVVVVVLLVLVGVQDEVLAQALALFQE